MNLNMFRMPTPAEQEALRQYAEREQWEVQCRALGVSLDTIRAYDAAARAYAMTALYPNERVVAEARKAAHDALLRGEPMPADPEQALRSLWVRELVRLIGP
jgi:hypothetical protein